MHAGQTWAGMSGLTALHMNLECTDGRRARSIGGLLLNGGRRRALVRRQFVTPAGAHYMMSLANPEWLIKNPVTPGTMMSGGMGYQNAEHGRCLCPHEHQ